MKVCQNDVGCLSVVVEWFMDTSWSNVLISNEVYSPARCLETAQKESITYYAYMRKEKKMSRGSTSNTDKF